jgi:hypothetical protein
VAEVARLLADAERERSADLADRVLRLESDEGNALRRRALALKASLATEGRESARKLKEEGDRQAAAGNLEDALLLYHQGRQADPANAALAEAHDRAAGLIMDEAHRLGYSQSQAAQKRRLYNAVIENSLPSDPVREQAMNQLQRLGLAQKWE